MLELLFSTRPRRKPGTLIRRITDDNQPLGGKPEEPEINRMSLKNLDHFVFFMDIINFCVLYSLIVTRMLFLGNYSSLHN